MLQRLIDEAIDQGYLEVNEDGEIEVVEDADIFTVQDLGFDRIDREKANGVGFNFDTGAFYLHIAQQRDRMPEEILYDPQVGLR